MHLRCPACETKFESDIQLPRDIYERSSLEGNVQPCPSCDAVVELSDETVEFDESDAASAS